MLDFLYSNITGNIIYYIAPILIILLDIKLEVYNQIDNFSDFIISNHISEFDVFILYYIFSMNNYECRWIGDERLQNLPILGKWSSYKKTIFINRLKNGITQLKKNIKPNDKIMFFPEGTLYYKPMITKSNEICKKNNMKKFNNVLCPKINGFNTITNIIKCTKITNITLIYHYKDKSYLEESIEPVTIINLIKNPPIKISVIIQELNVDYNDKQLINKIFRKKDSFIKKIKKNSI